MDVNVDFDKSQIIVNYQDTVEMSEIMKVLGEIKNNIPKSESDTKSSVKSQPKDKLKLALSLVRGSQSARFIKLLAEHQKGMNDTEVKKELGMSSKQNLGPVVAHISKCCKKAGIARSDLYTQLSRKGRDKKMAYFYKLSAEAVNIVRNIKNFEEEEFENSFEFE